jgi:hypothetical protein
MFAQPYLRHRLQGSYYGLYTPMLQKVYPELSDTALFSALLVGPLVGLVVQPLMGAASDKVGMAVWQARS